MALEEVHDQWKHRLSQFRKSLSTKDLASEVHANVWGKTKKPLHSEWTERMETFRKSLTTHNLTRFEENAEMLKEKQMSEQEGYRGLTNPDYVVHQQDDSEQELGETASPHESSTFLRAGVTEDDTEQKVEQKDQVNKGCPCSRLLLKPILVDLSAQRQSPSPKLRPVAVFPKLETPPWSPRTPISSRAVKAQPAVAQSTPTVQPTAPVVDSPRTPSLKHHDNTSMEATSGELTGVVAYESDEDTRHAPRKKLLREEAEHIKSLAQWLIGCIDAGDTASDVCYQVLNTKDCLPQSASREMEVEIITCLFVECAQLSYRHTSYQVVLNCLEQLTTTLFEGDTRSDMLLALRRAMGLPSMEERRKHEEALQKCETLESELSVMQQGFEQLQKENQRLHQQLVDLGAKPVESRFPTQVSADLADDQITATETTHGYMRTVCTMMKHVLHKLDSELGETTKKEQDVVETMKQNIASLENVTRVLEGTTKQALPQNQLTSLLEMESDFHRVVSSASLTKLRTRGISPVSPVGFSSISPVKWGTPLTGTGMPAKPLQSRSPSVPPVVPPQVGTAHATPNVVASTTVASLTPSLLNSSRTSTTAVTPAPLISTSTIRASVVGTPSGRLVESGRQEFGGRASIASSSGTGAAHSPARSTIEPFGIRVRSTTPIRAQQIKVDTSQKPKIKLMPRCRTPDQRTALQRGRSEQLTSSKTPVTKYGDSPLVMVKTTNGSMSCAKAIPLGSMSGEQTNQLRLKNGDAPVRVAHSKSYPTRARVEELKAEKTPQSRLIGTTNSSHSSQKKSEQPKLALTSRLPVERTSTISANKSVLWGRRPAKEQKPDTPTFL